MKKLIFTFLFTFLCFYSLFAIDFYTGNYKEALQTAKSTNKPLFLYFTAKWCGPCQYMQQYIFPDEALSQYVTQNYIALKLDIDTQEGKLIYQKVHQPKGPMGVPAFIIMNSEEEVLKRTAGAMKLVQLQAFLLKDKNAVAIYKALADSMATQPSGTKKKPTLFNKFMFNAMVSKWKPGIKIGTNFMGFRGSNHNNSLTMGYEFGLFFNRDFCSETTYKQFWSISRYTFQPGLSLSSKAGELGNSQINIQYLELDLANYYRIKGLRGFQLAISPYAALALWGKNKSDQGTIPLNFGQTFSHTDYGLKLGLGKTLGSFAAHGGYHLGLKDINLAENNNTYHRGFYASFALVIGK